MEKVFKTHIYAPEIEAKRRHQFILETFDALSVGEYFQLENDHDPRPLYYQFMVERENLFSWEYLEEGPNIWRVAIGKHEGL